MTLSGASGPGRPSAVRRIAGVVRRWLRPSGRSAPAERGSDGRRRKWETRWADPAARSPGVRWYGRDLDPEIVEAVESGFFPPGVAALDAGCGDGLVAAFLADRGFRAVGADIAEGAVAEARRRHPERPGALAFHRADLCVELPPGGPFGVVVDRGCYLGLQDAEQRRYVRLLAQGCTPDARMILSLRAFRDGVRFGDPAEIARRRAGVERVFGEGWRVERIDAVHTDPERGRNPETALGGLLVWLARVPAGA